MPFEIIAAGNGRSVTFWGVTKEEAKQELENCPNLKKKERLKINRIAAVFIETGSFPRNKEKFKSVEGELDLFAIKSHQIRLLGTFLDKKNFGISLCVRKKSPRYKPQDLVRAQQNKAAMIEEWKNEKRS